VLQESQCGRYEAHRSLCIRFLSRDRGEDDVIWLHVVMRVVFRNDVSDRRTNVATIVCWNHVIDRQEAADLRQRSNHLETAEDSSSGPPRPSTVVEIEEEGLKDRAANADRRSSKRGRLSAVPCEVSKYLTSDTIHCASSAIFSNSASVRRDEFEASRPSSIQGPERDFGSNHIRCATSQDFLSTSSRCDENIPCGVRDRRKETTAAFTTDSIHSTTSRNLSPLSTGSCEEFRTRSDVRGEAEVNAIFTRDDLSGSPTFSFGLITRDDYREHVRDPEKRNDCEKSSLTDDIIKKSSASPVQVTPISIGVDPVLGNTLPDCTDGQTFLTNPSPPMDRQRYAEPWRHCSTLPWFGQKRFNPFQLEPSSAAGTALPENRCCSEMRSLQAAVSDLSVSEVWAQAMVELQRPPNFYDLPVLNAQEVDDVLDLECQNAYTNKYLQWKATLHKRP